MAVSTAIKCAINYLRLIIGVEPVLRLVMLFFVQRRDNCLSKVDSICPLIYNATIAKMVEL